MAKEEIPIGEEQSKKGTIEDLTKDAERLIEIGNEFCVKSHLLLYGKGVTDSNKLSAIPYELAKLLYDVHPVLDTLTERGYKEVGWINLELVQDRRGSVSHEPEWLGGRRFLKGPGGFSGFNDFEGYALSRFSENSTEIPQDLYLVRLSYDEKSSKAAKNVVNTELGTRNHEHSSLFNLLNIEQEPEIVVMVDPATNPTFDELKRHLRIESYGGIICFAGLTGQYKAWKIGRLTEVPSDLFKQASTIKAREGSCLKNTSHSYSPHIDFASLDTNYGIGLEIKLVDSIKESPQ